jgi:hypothetical protein
VASDALVVLSALVYFLGVSAGLLLAYPRYLLPTLLSGFGISAIAHQLGAIGATLRSRAPFARVTAARRRPNCIGVLVGQRTNSLEAWCGSTDHCWPPP